MRLGRLLPTVVAAWTVVLSCASEQNPNDGVEPVGGSDAIRESTDAPAPLATFVSEGRVPSMSLEPTAVSASQETLMNRSMYWQTTTGLEGPADLQVWNERVALACEAQIWIRESAETIAGAFVHDDGGDTGDAALIESASWALWIIANHDSGCPNRFPRVATHPNTWIHSTGLFGPFDVATWRERLEPFCSIPHRVVVGSNFSEMAESIARVYITEDGGDPERPGLLSSAADILWTMSRTPGTCPEDSP